MNDVKMDKRPYRSPLRREQAEATRQRILEAGLRLFAERGYAASSISQIALEAGVSTETIYASVGSKRGIIDALLAQVDTMRIPDKAREAAAARGGGARVAIEVLAEMAVGFWATHHVLVGVLRKGIGDPEIGQAWVERQQARRGLIDGIVSAWPRGSLRTGLDAQRASDIAWALTSDEMFDLLVGMQGWTIDAYRDWLKSALVRELLFDAEAVRESPQGAS
jgi:AcrR family transcriptional regulator